MRLFRRRPPAPMPDVIADLLDELSLAYTAAPGQVLALLAAHADAELRLDAAAIDTHSTPEQLAMAAAEADGTRAALLGLSPTATRQIRTAAQETTR